MQRHTTPPRPTVQRPDIRDQGRFSLQQAEHGRDGTTGGIDAPVFGEERLVRLEPSAEYRRGTLVLRNRLIARQDGVPIASDGTGIAEAPSSCAIVR
jgi:hypothetical protein